MNETGKKGENGMGYILGIGEYGSCELFGSTTVCALHIPELEAPELTAKFLDWFLNREPDDYEVFRILKEVFPNYKDTNMIEWLSSSHYYEMAVENDISHGVMNFLAPSFDADAIPNQIVAYAYSIDTEELNQMMELYGNLGAIMYTLISDAIDRLNQEFDDVVNESDGDGGWQLVANSLATTIARAGYLAQIQRLEAQCNASLPMGVSKQANDFYLNRCVHMTPEDKKKLFKVYLMERRNH